MKIPHTGYMIRKLETSVNQLIDRQVKAYGISYGQFEYFMHIANHPDLTQQDLAQMLGVTKASVTKAIRILEEAHLVTRGNHPTDKRANTLTMSPKGQGLIAEIETFKDQMEADLFKDIPKEEINAFNATLTKLNKNAQDLLK